MWSRLLCLSSLLIITATDTIFKQCSQIDFCNNLRNRLPEDKYTVTSYIFGNGSSTVIFTLESTENDDTGNLQLIVTALKGSTFRIQIAEIDSTRYQLTDVLDGDPELDIFESLDESKDNAVITIQDSKITVNYSPFSVQFSRNNVDQVLLNGARLVLENTESSQAFAFSVAFPQAARLYGIHEHAERLSLQNTVLNGIDPYRLRNVDYPNYAINSPMALYGAIPVLYGHGPTSTSGVFLHNGAQQFIDITNNSDATEAYIMAEGGSLDLFVFLGPTPKDVVSQYLNLTGIPHMPQLWTLGYHQSRWSYLTQEEVKDVLANLDRYDYPTEAIWLDVDYTDGKKYFTWNPDSFTDPEELQANISSTNRKLVVIIDPHIKVEEGYWVHDQILEAGLFVNNSDGSVFQGDCWPGPSNYIDFLNPAARDLYASMYKYDNFVNTTPTIAGIWNDMNEPSVFDDSLEKTMPNNAVHYGGALHRDLHNTYGFLQTKATHKALIDRDEGLKRPFILTRSHFAGSQRYTAIWTGDSGSDWTYLSITIPMCLNANILGILLCGADVGGFSGNPSEELLQRWYQAGAWLPFYRAHASSSTDHREPYLFPDDVQEIFRAAVNQRYRHLPQWYTLYFESIRNKTPLIRPLFYQYPNDINVVDIDLEFLVGTNILVRPVVEEGATSVTIYFPEGESKHWVNYESLSVHKAGDSFDIEVNITTVPVFYKAGSIIVRKDIIRPSSVDMEDDGHTLCVVLDENNTAYGTVYLDDRTSFNYRYNLEYNYLSIEAGPEIELISSSQTATKPTLSLNFIPIDSFAQSENFEFKVDAIEIITFQELPRDGKAGVATRIRYVRDIYGTLLTGMQLSVSKKVTLKL